MEAKREKDKRKEKMKDDTVLYDGKVYWRYIESKVNGNYLLSCKMGYDHDVSQEHLSKFKIIGTYKGNEHLFECD